MNDAAPALVLVSTPIGNLGDLSSRARSELEGASVIACEDSRRTGQLCAHFGIEHAPFLVCHEHNENSAATEIVDRVRRGERVVLVSDAGTPAVSDPGRRVVDAAIAAGIEVTAVPGASAVLAALVVSGLAADRFCFEGFLPRKGRARAHRLAAMAAEERTIVMFESPRRVAATLSDLGAVMAADRRVVVARELTKRFEEIWRGTLSDAAVHFGGTEPRGEFVLVVSGAEPHITTDASIVQALVAEVDAGATRREAIDAVVDGMGVAKRRVYDLALTVPVD